MSFLGKKPADVITSGQQLVNGTVTAIKLAAGAALSNLGFTPVDQASLAGQVAFYGMSSAPTGWLKANGAAVSRTTYATLFAAIGTTFGTGDGSSTFNLPDLRGEFPRGWDDSRGVDSGRAFGSAQSGQVEAHTHQYNSYQNAAPNQAWINGGSAWGNNGPWTSTSYGGNETRPRNIALLACIRY